MTLNAAFANSAITSSANYTISQVPNVPPMLQHGIIYGSLAHIMTDQNDPNAKLYLERYMQTIMEAKKIYVTRTYSQDIDGIQTDWDYRR